MDIIDCYRLLELTSTANREEVKSSYRRLARQLHPDVNPNNTQAQEQFIRVTEAYKVLVKIVPAPQVRTTVPSSETQSSDSDPDLKVSVPSPPPSPSVTTSSSPASPNPDQSFADQKLKFDTYRQLEDLIKRRNLPRAIALIEALQTRLPNDPEICQWQAIIYQRWGRQLIEDNKLNQARAYLNKALKTDPHNKTLSTAIEIDLKRIMSRY